MSRVVDPADFDSAILFGDAASATILYGHESIGRSRAIVRRPVLSAKGEDGTVLSVPAAGWGGYLKMNGKKVFAEAIKQMVAILKRACAEAGIQPTDLNLVVPHQANARIVEAVRQRAGVSIGPHGQRHRRHGQHLVDAPSRCALRTPARQTARRQQNRPLRFGAGFTMGAGIVELPVDVRACGLTRSAGVRIAPTPLGRRGFSALVRLLEFTLQRVAGTLKCEPQLRGVPSQLASAQEPRGRYCNTCCLPFIAGCGGRAKKTAWIASPARFSSDWKSSMNSCRPCLMMSSMLV